MTKERYWGVGETSLEEKRTWKQLDSLVSVMCLVDCFFYLCSIIRNNASFHMSYEAQMWCLYAFCGGYMNWMVEGVDCL